MPAREIRGTAEAWSWLELDLIDEDEGGAPLAHRDALKLLAVFLQHTDSKPEQQRLVCLDEKDEASHRCERPFMLMNDVGLTFGRATLANTNLVSSMNLDLWSQTPVWKGDSACVGNLPRSLTGTLKDPVISEQGRAFLADLLTQLSDAQIRALFEQGLAVSKSGVHSGIAAAVGEGVGCHIDDAHDARDVEGKLPASGEPNRPLAGWLRHQAGLGRT